VVVLGINTYHANSSAALVVDGTLVAAVEEERFTRQKYDTAFPAASIRYCLEAAGLRPRDLRHLAVSKNPLAHFGRKVWTTVGTRGGRRMAPKRGDVLSILGLKRLVANALDVSPGELPARVHFVEHHRAHIGSAYYVSPFDQAAVVSLDGSGDMVSGMWGAARGHRLDLEGRVYFPHSIGVFYQALTQYLGFTKWGDEYKVMGLSSYGEPRYADRMRALLEEDRDGPGYRLGLEFFRHHVEHVPMTWRGGPATIERLWSDEMERRFGPARSSAEPIEERHRDLAASMQRRLEEVVLHTLSEVHRLTGMEALCMAGGVALNCVANGRIVGETGFRDLYVQPAAYDGGTAVGAAFYVLHHLLGRPRGYVMDHAYLGPEYGASRCRSALEGAGVRHARLPPSEATGRAAAALEAGKVVGWFQGRMEFGPRALGNRSILADPRRADMKDVLNARIKHREPFRPFAPSVIEEATGDYFEVDRPSPFMLVTYRVRKDKLAEIPAPTHVDGTGRVQTVRRDQNPRYYDLIRAFADRTGVPVLLNTSFNENEPICCTPEEAVDTFLRTRMDVLVLGDHWAEKA
jgi:carbamoyltransferase